MSGWLSRHGSRIKPGMIILCLVPAPVLGSRRSVADVGASRGTTDGARRVADYSIAYCAAHDGTAHGTCGLTVNVCAAGQAHQDGGKRCENGFHMTPLVLDCQA